jgi:hypothetical protein
LQLECSTSYLVAFESDLWSRLIPQVVFGEGFAEHAVIALGAINKAAEILPAAYEQSSFQSPNLPYGSKHHETALKHYGKVIALLRQQMENPYLDERIVQMTLIACLLLGCFENAHGGVKAIMLLFQSGVKILSDFKENRWERNLVSTRGSSKQFSKQFYCYIHERYSGRLF